MTDEISDVPRTPKALLADNRFADGTWLTPDGKTFYQLCEARWGVDETAHLWWNAICLEAERRDAR